MTTPTDGELAWWAPLSVLRPDVGARLPPVGRPFRVAFVGQRTYFEVCSQSSPSPVVDPTFVEFRSGSDGQSLLARLRSIDPHVVVVFRPEIVPAGLLRGLDALTLGFLTEPLPRSDEVGHPDLDRRLQDLALADGDQFDRIVAFDPHIIAAASRYVPVWRAQPLPVADEVFASRLEPRSGSRSLFVGRSTPHREEWLLPAKHLYDLMHVEHGVFGPDLAELARDFLVAINLHNEPYPSFENRVALHLAVGNLVISEALSPTNGLDPGLDFLQADDPDEMVGFLGQIEADPQRFHPVRARGHLKAEAFRASRVFARLVLDLLLDVAEFGRTPR